eukprot:4458008-Alexandrium_andersonii.AAC.1
MHAQRAQTGPLSAHPLGLRGSCARCACMQKQSYRSWPVGWEHMRDNACCGYLCLPRGCQGCRRTAPHARCWCARGTNWR